MNPIKRAVYETAVKALGHQKAEAARIHFKNSFTELSKLISTLGPSAPGVDMGARLLSECKKLKGELGVRRIGLLVNETSAIERYAQLPLEENGIALLTFDHLLSAWGKRNGVSIRFADGAALLGVDLVLVDHAAAEEEFLNALRACAQLDETIPVLALVRSQIASRSTQGTFWYGGGVETYAYFYNYFSSFYQIKEAFQLHVKVTGPDGTAWRKTIWIHPDAHVRIGCRDLGIPADQTRLYQFEYTGYHPRFRFTSPRIRFGFDIVTPRSVASLHSMECGALGDILHRFHDATDRAECRVLTFRSRSADPVRAKVTFRLGDAEPFTVSTQIPPSPNLIRKLVPREILRQNRPDFSGPYTAEVLFEDPIEMLEDWCNDLTLGLSDRIDGNHIVSAAKPRALPEKRLSDADIEVLTAEADISFVGFAVPLFHRSDDRLALDAEVSFHTQSQAANDEWWAHLKLIGTGNQLVAKKLLKQGLVEPPLNLNKVFADDLRAAPPGEFVVLVEPKLEPRFDSIKAYGASNPFFRLIHRRSGDSDTVELQGGFAVNLPGYLSAFPSGYSGRYSNKNRTNIISRLVSNDRFETHSVIMYRTHGSTPARAEAVRFELLLANGRSRSLDLEIGPNSMIVMPTSELIARLGVDRSEAKEDFFWLRVTSPSCTLTGYSILEDAKAGSVGLQHFWGA